jgi:transposase
LPSLHESGHRKFSIGITEIRYWHKHYRKHRLPVGSLVLAVYQIIGISEKLFGLIISTSGLSYHIISVAKIMKTVYDKILHDVKTGNIMQADETGWRVSGANWWLWVFATNDSAFFTIDKSRGKDVVRRVLGELFFGVLVVDGWAAYLAVTCKQQSCMAHLLRKIRKLHDAFPQLSSVYKFYIKFRKILRDGERLQTDRKKLGEKEFKFRLVTLYARLDYLLKWERMLMLNCSLFTVCVSYREFHFHAL